MDANEGLPREFGKVLKAAHFLTVLLHVLDGVGGRAYATDKHLQGCSCMR